MVVHRRRELAAIDASGSPNELCPMTIELFNRDGHRCLMFTDIGSGFGVKSLFQDPDIKASYAKYSDIAMFEAQQKLARKKDVVSRWFGEWDEVNGTSWQVAMGGSGRALVVWTIGGIWR